jgi:hypothetical protein
MTTPGRVTDVAAPGEHEHGQGAEHGHGHGQDADAVLYVPEAVPVTGEVRIAHHVVVRQEAADYGAYSTIPVPAAAFNAMALPYDAHRKIAYLSVQSGGPVFIGTEAQAKASPPLGGQLAVLNQLVPVTHKQEVWIAGNGSAASVLVTQERWKD